MRCFGFEGSETSEEDQITIESVLEKAGWGGQWEEGITGTTMEDTWAKLRGRVEVGERSGFSWGGVEGWGKKAYNYTWITIKIKKKKKRKNSQSPSSVSPWLSHMTATLTMLLTLPVTKLVEGFSLTKQFSATPAGVLNLIQDLSKNSSRSHRLRGQSRKTIHFRC